MFGPHLEDQLRPHGYTLRHFPQSFRFSTLGGWIATRSGGHYATNHTHIDDFVESVRMLTPQGWWESRRLPGSGAGPSPDRMVIGSEGILGVITEAWMRIQRRPEYRATAGVTFDSWPDATEAVRQVAQAKLWPANLRVLDPAEAHRAAGLDGTSALLIIGFESSDLSQRHNIAQAVEIVRGAAAGSTTTRSASPTEAPLPRGERAPWARGGTRSSASASASTRAWAWSPTRSRPPSRGTGGPSSTHSCATELARRCARCSATSRCCRAASRTSYTDGPAPYYTWSGMGRQGSEISMWEDVKHAAGEALLDAGGTITHHHAVGRMHRPQYDRQRPDLFADALRAAKATLDPGGLLNPGVLIDP